MAFIVPCMPSFGVPVHVGQSAAAPLRSAAAHWPALGSWLTGYFLGSSKGTVRSCAKNAHNLTSSTRPPASPAAPYARWFYRSATRSVKFNMRAQSCGHPVNGVAARENRGHSCGPTRASRAPFRQLRKLMEHHNPLPQQKITMQVIENPGTSTVKPAYQSAGLRSEDVKDGWLRPRP